MATLHWREHAAAASAAARSARHPDRALDGSARARSITSRCVWMCRPRKFMAWRRSMECFLSTPRPPIVAHVCDDIACLTRGADTLCAEMEKKFGAAGSPCADGSDLAAQPVSGIVRARAGCADHAPRAKIHANECLLRRRPNRFSLIAMRSEIGCPPSRTICNRAASPSRRCRNPASPSLPPLASDKCDPSSLDDYRQLGGYEALRQALDMGPEGIVREVIASKLLGRGGAAFPDRQKMGSAAAVTAQQSGRPHYVICNADESEPGTFKDRVVMEGDPFAILEGMTIAALAIGAQQRIHLHSRRISAGGRAIGARDRLRRARKDFSARTFLAPIFNLTSKFGAAQAPTFAAKKPRSSIRSKATAASRATSRRFPRNPASFTSPPSSTTSRLSSIFRASFSKAARPMRADWHGAIRRHADYFASPAHCQRPGVYEVPFGATLRELIDLAGGVAGTGNLQAILLGGAAGSFVSPTELDTPLTFEGTRAIGATLGSGVIMLFDDTIDLKRILLRIAEFFSEETCGQCVPCRVGVTRQKETLATPGREKAARFARTGIEFAKGNGAGHARCFDLRPRTNCLERDSIRSQSLESVRHERSTSRTRDN